MARKVNLYLVFIRSPHIADEEDPCEVFCETMTARQIFNRMDMSDCSDETIEKIYLLKPENKRKLVKAEFHNTWHVWKDPLRMSITVRGKEIDHGYGTDH